MRSFIATIALLCAVTLAAQDQPGALSFVPNVLNLRPANGIFTTVQGLVTATFKLPAG